VNVSIRSALQIAAVSLGFGVAGLVTGYAIASLIVGIIGFTYVSVRASAPTTRHVKRIIDFAKFSWLGNLKKQSFSWVDVTVLGFFVVEALIGIYSIAWSIAAVLTLFSKGLSKTFFPMMSEIAEESRARVAEMLTESLRYNGLIFIPGLVGATIVGERILFLYGEEFIVGTTILVVLIAARMVYSYQTQFVNTINGIDRPDVAFRINAVFIGTNVILNVVLIWQYGWLGAAAATLLASTVSLFHAYGAAMQFFEFSIPLGEIGYQAAAAFVMGVFVYGIIEVGPTPQDTIISHGFTVSVVALGASVYFLTLLAISSTFRGTVRRNLPVDVPLL